MISSMTGFARRETQHPLGVLACELRTVNHRYLDLSLKLPDEFKSIEGRLRELAAASLKRGKLDCFLRFQSGAGASAEVQIDHDVVNALLAACAQIEGRMIDPARTTAIELLRWPGVVRNQERDLGPLQETAVTLFKHTLVDLQAQRAAEGERLQSALLQRHAALKDIVARLHARAPSVLAALRDKLAARIVNLGVQPEPGRLEQELAYVAQRLDVTEELDRLDSHLASLKEALEQGEPVGRKLDFLMQEFNREANTLGSKSVDLETTQCSVEMKVLIEQMREQIQNIE